MPGGERLYGRGMVTYSVAKRDQTGANDHVLYLGWHDYMLAIHKPPVEAQVFQMWYFALYPREISQPSAVDQAVQKSGSAVRGASRGQAQVACY